MLLARFALAALLLAIMLVAAACGGDDDDEASSATTTQETTTSGGSGGGGGRTLNGSVGPGFDISLDGTDGITAGDYTLVVDDQSSSHNFHLTGPGGVDVSTDVDAFGGKTFQVTLEPGEYRFVCDPHASSMNGSFTVG